MDITKHTERITDLQSLLNAKEAEWIQYVNSNEIPQPLRNLLVEWHNLKAQVSEAMCQLANAYNEQRESNEKEFQEKIKAIESKYPEEIVQKWKAFNEKTL